MPKPVLQLGSAWSSSWSLVGWMACRLGGLEAEERTIFLSRPDGPAKLKAVSPSGRVPALHLEGMATRAARSGRRIPRTAPVPAASPRRCAAIWTMCATGCR
jgi:glutathione S-transferase